MTNPNCDVCCGRGKIRVPVYGRVSAAMQDAAPTTVANNREYPCPECSDIVPMERLMVVKTESLVNSQPENDPRYMERVCYGMARQLVDELFKRNLVKIERGSTDTAQMRFVMRATLGVVAPRAVATLQERVAEHQEALAREVMAEASRSIQHWGSEYGTTGLSKAQAVDSMREALRTVLDARAKWRAA